VTEREHWHTAADGTRLFAREVGPLASDLTPLLCLPGLTRNSRDFEPVFEQFGTTRRVIAMDFRGRGKSGHAADPTTYRPDVELQDTLGFLGALSIHRVALLGTSRGGIVGMLMAAFAKAHLAGLMLNDIGCELQTDGLLRIKDYVAKPVCHESWEAAAKSIATGARGFANVAASQWEAVVRRIYVETTGGIRPSHDPRLANTIPSDDDIRSGKVGELWSVLPALHDVPFALLRGEGSDLLSIATVDRMQREAPGLVASTIAGRGHVPFLDEPKSIAAIQVWLEQVDPLN
jgi:pimeloyl-ACP methyl ester carboxylesterase